MAIKIGLLVITLLISRESAQAHQDVLESAKNDVKVLSSAQYDGRGFVDEGHRKAADYIKKRFKDIGLSRVGISWMQEFEVAANILHNTHFIMNGDSLEPGIDFVPYATTGAGSAKEVESILYAEQGLFIPDLQINQLPIYSAQEAILVMDNSFPDSLTQHRKSNAIFYSKSYRIQAAQALKAQAVVFLSSSLSHEPAVYQHNIPAFNIQDTAWPMELSNISYSVDAKFDTLQTQNVIGKIEGTQEPDSIILLSAHYDHFGKITHQKYFPGANDNASGVAMLLSLAEYFVEHPPDYTLVFAAFGAEELGLKGSEYFAANPFFNLNNVKFLINYDMVASGTNGIVAVGGKEHAGHFKKLKRLGQSLQISPIKARENAPISDHYPFLIRDIAGFYLYTNEGDQPYHHINDKYETLEWDDFNDVYKLSVEFISSLTLPENN